MMGDPPTLEPNDPFARFIEIAGGVGVLDPVRAVANWNADAPNPLVIIGGPGSGKTTLLRIVVDLAQRLAPEKKIVWLGDRVFVRPSTSDGPPSLMSTGEKIVNFLTDEEALSADMLIIDDAIGLLDQRARITFWENLTPIVLRKASVVIALSNREMLADDGIGAKHSLLARATVVRLDPQKLAPDHSEEPTFIAAEQAAAQLRALEARELPQQATVAPRFDYSGNGPIAIAPEPAPTITVEKLELYEELRLKAQQFLTLCPPGANRTARVRAIAESLAEYLPRDLVDVQPRRLWSRANTLRRHRDADLRLRRSGDPDELPLPELVAELLSDLVEQFNVFALHDDVLRQLDAGSLGPRDRAEVLLELEAGRVFSRAIAETPRLAEPSAAAVLIEATEQANEAAAQVGINADQALSQALETQRNGAIAVLAKALSEVKARIKSVEDGAWKYVGTESAKFVFTNFVRLYEGPISSLLNRVQGGKVASYVLRLLRHLLGS